MAAVGDELAHFRIERLLGAGGMGEVYVAFDAQLERRVALKLLPDARAVHAESRLRMLREARAASALAHPGIVTVFEIGEHVGRTYIAMELVDGETLAQLIARRGALPPAEAVGLLRQAGDAIDAAHAAGILHRDLKTANLMLARGGRVKVLDFGLSKRVGAPSQPPSQPPRPRPPPTSAIDAEAATVAPELDRTVLSESPPTPSGDVVTVHGARMGTPGSAAPELMDGDDADVRSDVFSLGVVLHELVTGKPPFPWTSWDDIRQRILERRYAPASEVVPGAVGARLDAVIARALAPSRDDRYATVAELMAAAEAAVTARRPRWPIFAGVGAVAIGAVIAGALAWPRGATPAEAPDAGPPRAIAAGDPLGKPVQLSHTRSCGYAPAFADATTVVYDVTPPGGAPDLWSQRLPDGAAVQLTATARWEWRAVPGRGPGKVLFLIDDDEHADDAEAHGIAELDLATRAIEKLSGVTVPGAVTVGGDLYYLTPDGQELRRVRSGIDETFASLGLPDPGAQQLTASPDGRWLAVAGEPPDVPLTLIEVASGRVRALPAAVPGNTRPAFSPVTPAIYYLGAAGVRRIGLDGTGDELIGPELKAAGGLAVSPDGAWLVYSNCDQRAQLLDVSASPPVELADETYAAQPVTGRGGWLAWVSQYLDYAVLMVRHPDGKIEQLTSRTLGKVSTPSFDRTSSTIAFAVSGGDHPGIYVMGLAEDGPRRVFGMTGREGDALPLFAGDDLLFTRWEGGMPWLLRSPIAGGVVERVLDDPAMAFSVSGNGAVLLATGPDHAFRMLDPRTGKGSTLRLPGDLVGIPKFSPDGAWIVVTGEDTVWRIHVGAGRSVDQEPAEKVMDVPSDGLAGYATIDDDGHVIAAPSRWAGEIYGVPAPTGTRW